MIPGAELARRMAPGYICGCYVDAGTATRLTTGVERCSRDGSELTMKSVKPLHFPVFQFPVSSFQFPVSSFQFPVSCL